jgi:hypothetical protein
MTRLTEKNAVRIKEELCRPALGLMPRGLHVNLAPSATLVSRMVVATFGELSPRGSNPKVDPQTSLDGSNGIFPPFNPTASPPARYERREDSAAMGGGVAAGDGTRSLDQTPTRAVAAVIVATSLILEGILHHLGKVPRLSPLPPS